MNATVQNWKTSLAGIVAGVVFAMTNQHDWKHVVIALAMALTGVLAHDA